jgi:hypothetical protein
MSSTDSEAAVCSASTCIRQRTGSCRLRNEGKRQRRPEDNAHQRLKRMQQGGDRPIGARAPSAGWSALR